jgi:hypothetical protein
MEVIMSRNLRSLIALGQVIAERELSCEKPGEPARTIRVQVGAPVSDPKYPDNALCPVVLLGFDSEEKWVLGGVDSVQALVLALQALPSCLSVCAKQYGGSLTWLGSPDLGFPPPAQEQLKTSSNGNLSPTGS